MFRKMKRVLWPVQLVLSLAGLGYAVFWFYKNYSSLDSAAFVQLKGAVVLATALFLGAYLFRIPLFSIIARFLGMNIGFRDMFIYFYGTSIASYAPGRVITSISIAAKMGADNRPTVPTVKWIFILQATSLLACCVIGIGMVNAYAALALALCVGAGAIVSKRIVRTWLFSTAGMVILWLVLALPFAALVAEPGTGISRPVFLQAVAVIPVAYIGSFFAAFTPDGIGVREAIVALSLQRFVQPSVFIPAMIWYRCLKIVFDMCFFFMAIIMETLRNRKRAAHGPA
jgi:hypothetical protein